MAQLILTDEEPDGFKWHDLIQLLIDNKCQIYSFEDHRELMKWLAELPQ